MAQKMDYTSWVTETERSLDGWLEAAAKVQPQLKDGQSLLSEQDQLRNFEVWEKMFAQDGDGTPAEQRLASFVKWSEPFRKHGLVGTANWILAMDKVRKRQQKVQGWT